MCIQNTIDVIYWGGGRGLKEITPANDLFETVPEDHTIKQIYVSRNPKYNQKEQIQQGANIEDLSTH